MGICKFLNSCSVSILEEAVDLANIRKELKEEFCVALMPSIVCDAWPIYVLNDLMSENKKICPVPSVYVVPLGSNDYWIKDEIESLLSDFYNDKEITLAPNYYDMSIEEVILLKCEEFTESLQINSMNSNCVLVRVTTCTDKVIFILGIMGSAEEVWDNVISKYKVPVTWLIDSHKGLGNWLIYLPLYQRIKDCADCSLLPVFYFKGKYISTSAPHNFEWIMDIKESSSHECVSQIYRTNC